MTKANRIAHLTSVHGPSDIRIYHKEATSLAEMGYELFFVVPSVCREKRLSDGVTTITVSRAKTRFGRIFVTSFRVFRSALRLRADIYHFHDPELIPWGLLLKILGKKVIIDIHENYPATVLATEWIHPVLRPVTLRFTNLLLATAVKALDGVVTADELLREKFAPLKNNQRVVSALNYPIIGPELREASIGHELIDFVARSLSEECRGLNRVVNAGTASTPSRSPCPSPQSPRSVFLRKA